MSAMEGPFRVLFSTVALATTNLSGLNGSPVQRLKLSELLLWLDEY